jgi:multisite-specific tRNA:(cytosine-C5)-methyltransferase
VSNLYPSLIWLISRMRLFPQDQNTGGFFVCVLEKAGSVKVEAETTDPVPSPPAPEEIPVVEDAVVADETGTSTLKRAVSPSAEVGPETVKKTKQEEKKEAKKEEKRKKRDPAWREDPFSYVDVSHKEVGLIVYVDLGDCECR